MYLQSHLNNVADIANATSARPMNWLIIFFTRACYGHYAYWLQV